MLLRFVIFNFILSNVVIMIRFICGTKIIGFVDVAMIIAPCSKQHARYSHVYYVDKEGGYMTR